MQNQKWRLNNPKVQEALQYFVDEARICAQPTDQEGMILGIAAMCTIFPCIMVLGEALANGEISKEIVDSFYEEMPDKRKWIFPPEGARHNDETIRGLLLRLRHGLAHAVSMPDEIALVSSRQDAGTSTGDRWCIIVPDFVEAVDETIKRLTETRPCLSLKRIMRGDRGFVEVQPSEGIVVRRWNTL